MNRLKGILAVCAALGWWGAIYPQFTMVKGTYEVVWEDNSRQMKTAVQEDTSREAPVREKADGGEIFWEIMGAGRDKVQWKSRLLTEFQNFAEAKEKD